MEVNIYIAIPPNPPTYCNVKGFKDCSSNGSCSPMSSIWGAIKMHIPASAFARCSTEKPPANILMSHVNAWPLDVSFANMKYYLPLILAMFDISPEGTNINVNVYFMWLYAVRCRSYPSQLHTFRSVGDFTVNLFTDVFMRLDAETEFNLSHGRYLKQKERWARDVAKLHIHTNIMHVRLASSV